MLTREGIITQCFLCTFFHKPGGIAKLHGSEFLRYGNYLFFGGGLILLGMNRLKHGRNCFHSALRNSGKNVAVKMDNTSLPFRLRIKIGQGFHQP